MCTQFTPDAALICRSFASLSAFITSKLTDQPVTGLCSLRVPLFAIAKTIVFQFYHSDSPIRRRILPHRHHHWTQNWVNFLSVTFVPYLRPPTIAVKPQLASIPYYFDQTDFWLMSYHRRSHLLPSSVEYSCGHRHLFSATDYSHKVHDWFGLCFLAKYTVTDLSH